LREVDREAREREEDDLKVQSLLFYITPYNPDAYEEAVQCVLIVDRCSFIR